LAARLGKGPSASRFGPASGNLATGLASEAPSFRSSWQSVMNAWRGVSRGTNGVESEEAGESSTAGTVSATEEGLVAKNGPTAVSATGASPSVASNLTATSQNVLLTAAAYQKEVPSPTSHSPWRAAQDADTQASPTAGAETTANERPGTTNRDHMVAAAQHDNQENPRQAVENSAQTITPAAEAPILLPVSPASPEISARTQTTEATSPSSSTIARSGVSSTPASGGAAAGLGTRSMHTVSASILRSRAQSNLAREAEMSSPDDISESAASRRMASLSSSGTSAIETQHEPASTRSAAGGESQSGRPNPDSKLDNPINPGRAENATDASTHLANVFGPVQSSAEAIDSDAKQTVGRSETRAASRGAAGETVADATPVVASQTATAGIASIGLRTPAAAQLSSAPASDRAQTSTATSAASSAQDTFSALDRGTSLGTPTWTHAGGQHAEAGFSDPALGWVGVRADLSASGIHATLVPDSAEAAQALNGHLAGLSSHLVEQQAPVVSLSMASPGDNGVESGTGQHMQQGAEGSPQGRESAGSQAGSHGSTPQSLSTSDLTAPAQSGVLDTLAYTGELRGTHVSVMA
jgi:hypothetical protein